MGRRFFTVREANELIPFLSSRLRELRMLHQNLRVWGALNPTSDEIALAGGMPAPRRYVDLLVTLQGLVEEICSEGCQIKDFESGLIDFPTIWEGREVFLCWKLGEPEVGHWHEIEAGFAGRQSLECEPEA